MTGVPGDMAGFYWRALNPLGWPNDFFLLILCSVCSGGIVTFYNDIINMRYEDRSGPETRRGAGWRIAYTGAKNLAGVLLKDWARANSESITTHGHGTELGTG